MCLNIGGGDGVLAGQGQGGGPVVVPRKDSEGGRKQTRPSPVLEALLAWSLGLVRLARLDLEAFAAGTHLRDRFGPRPQITATAACSDSYMRSNPF